MQDIESIFEKEVRKNYLLSQKGLVHAENELERLRLYAIDNNKIQQYDAIIEQAEQEIGYLTLLKANIENLQFGFDSLDSKLKDRILYHFSKPSDAKHSGEDLFDRIGISESDLMVCDVVGDSMIGAGIKHSDILLVNSYEIPYEGSIIVAEINDKLFVKRYSVRDGVIWLLSENAEFEPIIINSNQKFSIKGVVKHIVSQI